MCFLDSRASPCSQSTLSRAMDSDSKRQPALGTWYGYLVYNFGAWRYGEYCPWRPSCAVPRTKEPYPQADNLRRMW